ncbi:hypothetical protein PF007_g30903 [Phytophthora fragariae]|uniref:Uncharacterized protein n=1 Tax=Phytophthora fragariae TaxID=53985 RepID=A0A6A3PFZ7_9STRA|nr:hypothetical protein PF009_g27084 [Phytophthora fragariae]KAE9059587.1 hypothetical protein PF007_g30903 [Phytophthora fragariae]
MTRAAQDGEGQEETEGAVRAAPMTTAWYDAEAEKARHFELDCEHDVAEQRAVVRSVAEGGHAESVSPTMMSECNEEHNKAMSPTTSRKSVTAVNSLTVMVDDMKAATAERDVEGAACYVATVRPAMSAGRYVRSDEEAAAPGDADTDPRQPEEGAGAVQVGAMEDNQPLIAQLRLARKLAKNQRKRRRTKRAEARRKAETRAQAEERAVAAALRARRQHEGDEAITQLERRRQQQGDVTSEHYEQAVDAAKLAIGAM